MSMLKNFRIIHAMIVSFSVLLNVVIIVILWQYKHEEIKKKNYIVHK